jgi:hypothetical protein
VRLLAGSDLPGVERGPTTREDVVPDDEDGAAVEFGVPGADEGDADAGREGFDDFLGSVDDGTDAGRASVTQVLTQPRRPCSR